MAEKGTATDRWQGFGDCIYEVSCVLVALAQRYGIPKECGDSVHQIFLKAYARHHGPQAAERASAAERVQADLKDYDNPASVAPLPYYVMSEFIGG